MQISLAMQDVLNNEITRLRIRFQKNWEKRES